MDTFKEKNEIQDLAWGQLAAASVLMRDIETGLKSGYLRISLDLIERWLEKQNELQERVRNLDYHLRQALFDPEPR